jgi:methionine sulfoxide reductase catalytic subunit
MTRKDNRIKPSEITPEDVYFNRRRLVTGAMALGLLPACQPDATAAAIPGDGEFDELQAWSGSTTERQSPWEVITTYNNYYEFGQGKRDPSRNADSLITSPWSVEVTGEADKTGTFTLEDILKPHTLEERIYRHRCVERWSIVVPWVGFPMGDLLKRFEPRSSAKFVQFYTLADRDQMPGLRDPILDWPYLEGLTIEEAMHPLTLAAVGVYGKVLPNQNGAPIRLVVPWKYGYKSAKSIVRINFTDERPRITTESKSQGDWTWQTAWNWYAGNEYGFYSNVNPDRPHPRWSQEVEQRLDGRFPEPVIETRLFNGYAEEVADLYRGMDLIKNH